MVIAILCNISLIIAVSIKPPGEAKKPKEQTEIEGKYATQY